MANDRAKTNEHRRGQVDVSDLAQLDRHFFVLPQIRVRHNHCRVLVASLLPDAAPRIVAVREVPVETTFGDLWFAGQSLEPNSLDSRLPRPFEHVTTQGAAIEPGLSR